MHEFCNVLVLHCVISMIFFGSAGRAMFEVCDFLVTNLMVLIVPIIF